jgi:hypothetical protein
MGMANARVLPDPVTAFPITSWPARTCGMTAVCIGDGQGNSKPAIADSVLSDNERVAHSEMSTPSPSVSLSSKLYESSGLGSIVFCFFLSFLSLWMSSEYFCGRESSSVLSTSGCSSSVNPCHSPSSCHGIAGSSMTLSLEDVVSSPEGLG